MRTFSTVASPSQQLEAFKAIVRFGLGNRQGVVMNKLLLGSLVALTMGGSAAIAADMPLKAPPPVAVFSWTGCYVGIEGGGGVGPGRSSAAIAKAPAQMPGAFYRRRSRKPVLRSGFWPKPGTAEASSFRSGPRRIRP